MSRELLNVNNTDTIKQNDDSTTIILSAHDDNEPKIFKAGDIATVHIDTNSAHVKNIPAKLVVGSNNVNINSADLVNLPAGKYSLELWVSQKDGPHTTIYPSSGSLALTIDKNADDLTDKTLTTLTLDDLRKDLHADVADAVKHIKVDPSSLDLSDYAKKTDLPTVPTVDLDVDKRTLTINKQTINIPNSVDLSGYAKTSDVPNVKYNAQTKTLTVDGVTVEIPSTVDLSDYYTKEQVEQQIKENEVTVDLTDYVKREDLADLAKKTDVPAVTLDTVKRTITVNGTVINIPDNVDLSGYATKAELPKVTLDVAKRQIEVGDATLDIPASVDISNYYTKAQVDDKLATAAAGGKVDLSGYVKTEQLNDYAKKQDVPSVLYDSNKKQLTINGVNVDLPDNVDLSDYVRKEDTADFAKKTDIPTIALDTEKRTLTVNNNVINIPESVDLTGYVKTGDLANYALKSDIPAAPDLSEYALKSDIKPVDLTPYIKAIDADAKYATKSEIPDMSGYALKSDIKTVDLTPYLKKTDADSTYATKHDVENIKSQKGDRGTMIYSTNAQLSSKTMAMSVSIAALNQTTPTPRPGDYLIANIDLTTAISEITRVDSSDIYISSSYVNLQGVAGPSGSNGHSVWIYQGPSSDLNISFSSLANYQAYSGSNPQYGDAVVGNDGSISEITNVDISSQTITTGSILATIKAQSENTVPTNSTFDYSKYPNMPIISQENLGNYLGLDSTKSYTLNVDDNTLNDGTNTTQKALKPAIYLLRDFQNHGYNLTIKSDQNYGLAYGNAVELIVTPYMMFAVVVGPNSAETLCARTQWDHDSYGYYGVSNKWFIIGQESKATN